MKRKCKTCHKKHDRAKLDVMKAEFIPNAFCSEFCNNAYLLMNQIGIKRTGYIDVFDSSIFEVGQMVKTGDESMIIEAINENRLEVCKYQSVN